METIFLLKSLYPAVADGKSEPNFKSIINEMKRYGVHVSWDKKKKLMLFSNSKSDRFKPEHFNEYFAECNGLILNYQFVPVVVPRRSVMGTMSREALEATFDKFHIYELYDGSVINLYWHQDQWNISSFRGISINWSSLHETNWIDMFCSALHNMQIDPNDFFEKLDKKSSYTFGFSHEEAHPFLRNFMLKPHPLVWFIQKAECDEYGITIRKTFDEMSGFPVQRKIEISVETLYEQVNNAYTIYMQTGVPIYGFLLEKINNDGSTDIYENVLLESDLLSLIRKLFYDKHLHEKAKKMEIPISTFIDYYNFMDSKRTYYYSSLLPTTKNQKFADLELRFNELVQKLCSRLRSKFKLAGNPQKKDEKISKREVAFNYLFEVIRPNLRKSLHADLSILVAMIIRNPSYTQYFYEYLNA
jgi:hypothetical protein